MEIRFVTPQFSVAGQMQVSELAIAAAQGVKTIFNNRPDHEVEGQPLSADIETAAKTLGMVYLHLPVASRVITDDDVDDFARAYAAASGPILAFCRSGTRSISLWALAAARMQDVAAVLSATSAAGYDLSKMVERLAAQASNSA